MRRSREFGQLPGRNKLKAGSRLLISPFPEIKFILSLLRGAVKLVGSRRPVGKAGETPGVFPGLSKGPALARSGGDRRSRLPTNSQHLLAMASGGQCRRRRRLAKARLVRCSPAECLMWTPQVIPVEELAKATLLFDAVGGRTQIDPLVLHGPPQALDKDVVVAAPASVHADLDPVIPQ